MKRTYKVVTKPSTLSSRELAEFLSKDGQLLLPLVELLERGEKAIDEVIDVMGRATVEAVLRMSAEQLAGPKRQGRRADDRALYWHGSQPGRVTLSERQLRVEKPRLRKKTARQGERGEVAIPAYDAMQRDQRLADRMLAIMLNGVSTRRYETVLPAMAEQVGIGKSEVSRETIEAGTRVLQDLAERDFSKVDVLIIYLDGIQFGNHHVLAAVGVDEDGKKYVLGVRSGASENATVTTALLEDLVARGIRPDRRRLFVVDGAKALRSAIAQVFGAGNEVQRCRNHTLRNVVGHLPNAQHDQARATLRAAWKLEAQEGMRKLDQYASWLQRDWPDALTWDQGAEMAQHAQLRIDTGLHVFFCDPRSPWQRGTNENTNGLLRQYFPKGTDLNRHSASDVAAVAATLNRRPRKTLGWKTPSEAFNELLLSHQRGRVATTP